MPPKKAPPEPPPVSPVACEPALSVSEVLPAGCAGEPYFARLVMHCAGATGATPEVQWRPTALPEAMTLTPQGELRGNSELAAGSYVLQARARVAELELPVALQLEVLDRCWLFAAARQPAAAQARVLALRLDGAGNEPLWLPESLPAEESVSSFATSPDGRYLAAVSSTSAGERALRLFRVLGGRVQELALQHSGSLLAHAFSPDSAQLALVTDLNRAAGAPRDTRLSVLALSELDAQAGAHTVAEDFPISYEAELGWADAATLEFIGDSEVFAPLFSAQVVHLPAAGLAAAELEEVFYPFDPVDTMRWFRPLPGGLFAMTAALLYINAEQTVSALHLRAQALSPTYEFSARAEGGRLLLHAPEVQDLEPPSWEAEGCERLLTWSEDGRTLVCVFQNQLVRFSLGANGLAAERLDTAWSAAEAGRSTLSAHAGWLALTHPEHGMFLLPAAAPTPALPLLPFSADERGWDLAFSSDERWLWVQQGRRLSVAQILQGEAPRVTLLSEAMAEPATCVQEGLPLPDEWCGAARLHSDIALRGAGRFLAFADAAGVISLADLLLPERKRELDARLSEDCPEDCIQFQ